MISDKENKREIPLAIRFRNNLKRQLVKYKQVDELVHESDPEARLQPVQAAFDMSVITAMADQIKQLTGLASNIEQIKNVQSIDSEKINNVHARLNNDLPKKQKPLTKKQREEAEIEEMRKNAHDRIRLNGYKR